MKAQESKRKKVVQISKNLFRPKSFSQGKEPVGSTLDVDPKAFSLKYFVIFLILGAAGAALSSYFIATFNGAPGRESLISGIVALTIFSFVALFQTLFLRNFQAFLWVSLAEAVAFFSFLGLSLSAWSLFAAILLIWQLILGRLYGSRILNERFTFGFFRFAQHTAVSIGRAIALFLAVFYVGLYASFGLSQSGFDFFVRLITPVVEPFVPGFSSDMSVHSFYDSLAQKQIQDKFAEDQRFVALPQAQKEEVFSNASRELRVQAAELTQITAEADDSASSYFYRVASKYLPGLEDGSAGTVSIFVFIFSLFSIFSFVALIIRTLVVIPVSWLIYQLLFMAGLIKVRKENVSREVIYFS